MRDYIDLGPKRVGYGYPVFIIAEAGVNHNGDVALGMELIESAARSGADAVKFQCFITDDIVTKKNA